MAATKKPLLVLIDGYSLLFRAFFAPGPFLSTTDGLPTGALFGFANSLLMVLEQEKPDAVYVAWDAPGKTFRHDSFEAYKANRPEAGEDLKKQLPVARELVEAMGIAAVEEPTFEADDLIGTLADEGVKEGYEVLVVTGDTDELQLVRDGVKVRMVRRGLTETKLYDEAAVVERYGIPPVRIPDYKALVGDSSDNIPGVSGIGDKTATKLLQEFGSVENLIAHRHELPPGKIKDNLLAAADQPFRSVELATIHRRAPFDGPVKPYQPTSDSWARAREMFQRLEFRSLIRRIPELSGDTSSNAEEPTSTQIEVVEIESDEQLRTALREAAEAEEIAICTSLIRSQPVRAELNILAFAVSPEKAYMVNLATPTGPAAGLFAEPEHEEEGFRVPISALQPLFQGARWSAHNAKYECIVLCRRGLEPGAPAFDSMIAGYLLSPGRSAFPMDALAEEYLHVEHAQSKENAQIAADAALVLALHQPMKERLAAESLEDVLERVEMPLVPILAEMERTGVPVDRKWLGRLSDEMQSKIAELTSGIHELAGEPFAIGSTQQLQRILYEKLQLQKGKKIKTGYSTAADVLQALAVDYEICARIIEYREVTKLKSTYADALPKLINPETGRLHTSLNQTVAATGRLSSSDPNLQNIPIRSEVGREIRKAFVAPPGQVLLSCDYSQIELRVFAHFTQDSEMVRAFEADEDIHVATATHLFNVELDNVTPEMRRRAKTVNFAVMYGQGEFGLASTLGISSEEAREFIKTYFVRFPSVRKYTEETLEQVRRTGFVQTILGRRRYFPDIRSGNFNIRQAAERAAVNMPIQGTAADIMKLAMIDVSNHLKTMCYNCALLLQVHDELLFGIDEQLLPKVVPEIARRMEDAMRLSVRLRVDARAGRNWAEMERV